MYKLTKYNWIIKLADNAWIPMEESNTDYQAYLKWLSEGNEPLPVDDIGASE